jgi:ubiquinone/menaquinone biosynthesis C-methylase UbiE
MSFFDHYSSDKATALGRGFARKSAQLLYSNIKKAKPTAQAALEIGPGKGDFCDLWLGNGGVITALEANPAMGQALSNKGVAVVEAYAPPLPFDLAEYDVVVASHVIEHMPNVTQAIELVEEMTRVCRPGGVVCIVAPDVRSWRFDFWNADYTHNYVTTPRRLEQLFANGDLRIEAVVLSSGHLTGFVGRVARFLAMCLPGALSGGGFLAQKLYKLKMTFLGNFMIIGRKP